MGQSGKVTGTEVPLGLAEGATEVATVVMTR
jgi:hypothetical protein